MATPGVYWQGANGNIYAKGNNFAGVQNISAINNAVGGDVSSALKGFQQIQDPNPPQQAAGGAGTGYTVGVNDPGTLASYDQGINNTQSSLNNIPGQVYSQLQGVDTSYQNALNQLLLGKNQANATYTTNKQQTGQDFVTAKNTIGTNAGNTLNGLLRLLGSRGAGGGSAYTQTAPQAVAGQATLQRTGAGNTFGANNQALDTNWNNYLTGYNNQVAGATNQRDQQKQSLGSQAATNQAQLQQQLASLAGERAAATGGNATAAAQPYFDAANQLLSKASNYTVAPINYQTQAYNAPALSAYTVNPNAAPTYQGQTPTNDYTSPYLGALLGAPKDKLTGQPTSAGG